MVPAVPRPRAPRGRRVVITGALVPRVGHQHVRLRQPPAELAARRTLAMAISLQDKNIWRSENQVQGAGGMPELRRQRRSLF